MKINKNILFKKYKNLILTLLIVSMMVSSCVPYKDDEILVEYADHNVLYYLKSEEIKYKYSDYIYDDITNEEYLEGTPSISDYMINDLEYDIPGFAEAIKAYVTKAEFIKKYKSKADEVCKKLENDYISQKNSYIYFYDKKKMKKTLLYDKLVTNITYDEEMPVVTFDVDSDTASASEARDSVLNRKIKLSDILLANSTIDVYMNVILATGKEKLKFFLDKKLSIE